jgi:chitinase
MFGGNKKAWLEHTWRKEKRELHYTELHKRWWSGNVKEWWDKQRDVDIKYQGVRHRVHVCLISSFKLDLKLTF